MHVRPDRTWKHAHTRPSPRNPSISGPRKKHIPNHFPNQMTRSKQPNKKATENTRDLANLKPTTSAGFLWAPGPSWFSKSWNQKCEYGGNASRFHVVRGPGKGGLWVLFWGGGGFALRLLWEEGGLSSWVEGATKRNTARF